MRSAAAPIRELCEILEESAFTANEEDLSRFLARGVIGPEWIEEATGSDRAVLLAGEIAEQVRLQFEGRKSHRSYQGESPE